MAEAISKTFIEDIIEKDLAEKANKICTRFPPEPNGYLHIGHAKAISVDFGMAKKYLGNCNLRMDDTNPAKEDMEYVNAIIDDVSWLIGEKPQTLLYASDYYDQLFDYAVLLIKKGKAYVCDLTPDEIREYRGTLTSPGKPSPYRERPIEENLELFQAMKEGKFPDGARVLRAKIDMAAPNINMRDPIMYRVLRAYHYRTGDKWCIYPMYDFAHPLSDGIEGITHSICTLEFEDHRPLYDWFVKELGAFECPPRQIEFARLNITRTIMSKRYLKRLVDNGQVLGWDDPRMPTISGLRRRGYTAEAIRTFCDLIGVAKANSQVDAAMLEYCVRDDLNQKAHRMMAVLRPVKIIIENWEQDRFEEITLENMPGDELAGSRTMRFGREIYIEQEDFMEEAPKKFFRLTKGGEVRLKNAYIIKCHDVIKNEDGSIKEILCTYDPDTKSGSCQRKVKGTLHWVSQADALKAEFRLYDYLLMPEDDPQTAGKDFSERMNPNSLETIEGLIEPYLASVNAGDKFQFMRVGYFCMDKDSTANKPVFNRIVSLKDSFKPQQ